VQFSSALALGATENIKKSVASSGVKDTTTGYILEMVVELGKKLCKWGAGIQAKPEAEVKAILEKQLKDLLRGSALDDAINLLLDVEGNIYVLIFCFTLTCHQDSMFIRTC
jgi:hypothetical protein